MQGTSYENMTIIVKDYVDSLISKYPYWNRTLGADHFFVTCHDVGVRATEGVPFLVKNAIRVVCSPSYDVSFIPHKDVGLPQVLQPFALPRGGNDIENRLYLLYLINLFFAFKLAALMFLVYIFEVIWPFQLDINLIDCVWVKFGRLLLHR